MRVSLTEAKTRLTELVRRAEAGEEVVLTRHGHDVVGFHVMRAKPPVDMEARRRTLNEIMASGAAKITPGPSAARSQDFLYDDDGLPG